MQVAAFRQAMQRYTKRVAIAAVGVRPWVQRLQVRTLGQVVVGQFWLWKAAACPPTTIHRHMHVPPLPLHSTM